MGSSVSRLRVLILATIGLCLILKTDIKATEDSESYVPRPLTEDRFSQHAAQFQAFEIGGLGPNCSTNDKDVVNDICYIAGSKVLIGNISQQKADAHVRMDLYNPSAFFNKYPCFLKMYDVDGDLHGTIKTVIIGHIGYGLYSGFDIWTRRKPDICNSENNKNKELAYKEVVSCIAQQLQPLTKILPPGGRLLYSTFVVKQVDMTKLIGIPQALCPSKASSAANTKSVEFTRAMDRQQFYTLKYVTSLRERVDDALSLRLHYDIFMQMGLQITEMNFVYLSNHGDHQPLPREQWSRPELVSDWCYFEITGIKMQELS